MLPEPGLCTEPRILTQRQRHEGAGKEDVRLPISIPVTRAQALIDGCGNDALEHEAAVKAVALFDHEECGSASAQGACSSFPCLWPHLTCVACLLTTALPERMSEHQVRGSITWSWLQGRVVLMSRHHHEQSLLLSHAPAGAGGPVMRDAIHRVAGALSEGRPDAVVRAIQNSFLVRPRTFPFHCTKLQAPIYCQSSRKPLFVSTGGSAPPPPPGASLLCQSSRPTALETGCTGGACEQRSHLPHVLHL